MTTDFKPRANLLSRLCRPLITEAKAGENDRWTDINPEPNGSEHDEEEEVVLVVLGRGRDEGGKRRICLGGGEGVLIGRSYSSGSAIAHSSAYV